jgi:hypothetical protein
MMSAALEAGVTAGTAERCGAFKLPTPLSEELIAI